MRLYHVITTYHLLSAITMQIQSKDDAILLVPRWIPIKYPQYLKLKKYFQDIIIIDNGYRYKHSKNETFRYFSHLVGNIVKYSDIYVWGAQLSFGIMLAENNIPFTFCEEATGMLTRPEILQHIEKKDPVKRNFFDYVNQLGLYTGDNNCIKLVICNISAQIENNSINNTNIMNYNIVEELSKLCNEDRKYVMEFFADCNKIHIPKNSVIIFTQHLANLRLITLEEQALCYQILVDYFFYKFNIVLKPHPDDLLYYSLIFPYANVIRDRFPSEFLPFLIDNQPDCIATIYSTAIYNLKGYYNDIFELDDTFEKDFKKIHRYYVAMEVCKYFYERIYFVNTNRELISKLSNNMCVNVGIYDNFEEIDDLHSSVAIVIDKETIQDVDKIQTLLNEINEKTIIIFINYDKVYTWYNYNKHYLENIVPIVINKRRHERPLTKEFYSDINEEVIYVFCKNKDIRRSIKNMEVSKKLVYTGIDIEKIPLDDKDEKIKVLEGILDATEQRLLYYINRVKELENK